ncbi:hypothetical protein O6H91_04G083800 [Diphasiastrum complanatum]|uniref:Uncharacterized protein n=1 Tax=Diphasiastrum complanatum TaxID=34168 RepID=A0ACC2DYT9_DIPCM|nr:hypothetical protein O6H91_04G083800 [Diphasiastrum complanatum]
MQKCLKARLKSGIYGLMSIFRSLRPMRVARKSSYSERGRRKSGDIRLHCIANNLHQFLGQSHTYLLTLILLLEEASVAPVVSSLVGAESVDQSVSYFFLSKNL